MGFLVSFSSWSGRRAISDLVLLLLLEQTVKELVTLCDVRLPVFGEIPG